METIKEVLIRRDGMTEEEAEALIGEAREVMLGYLEDGDMEAAYEICEEYFGLEPDYLMDLMPF